MRIDCTHGKEGITTWCSDDVMKAVGVDVSAVDRCVDNSFEQARNETSGNELLFEDKLIAEVYGISRHPALTINGQIYRGDLTGYDVFRAVCASFFSKDRPPTCDRKQEELK